MINMGSQEVEIFRYIIHLLKNVSSFHHISPEKIFCGVFFIADFQTALSQPQHDERILISAAGQVSPRFIKTFMCLWIHALLKINIPDSS